MFSPLPRSSFLHRDAQDEGSRQSPGGEADQGTPLEYACRHEQGCLEGLGGRTRPGRFRAGPRPQTDRHGIIV